MATAGRDTVFLTDLAGCAREQLEAAHESSSGRSACTVLGGHDRVLRQTVVAIVGGRVTDDHEDPGETTLQVLAGQVRLRADDTAWDAGPGEVLLVPPVRHALEALTDTVVLRTVATVDDAGRRRRC